MGRLGEDMELTWGSILPHFTVWKIYGKRLANAIHCMGKLWEYNFHIYLIAATHLLALRLLLKIVRDQ